MVPGTGPGRGLPWWRRMLLLRIRRDMPWTDEPEPPRPGHLVAVIGRKSR